jgi:hypothetical protein
VAINASICTTLVAHYINLFRSVIFVYRSLVTVSRDFIGRWAFSVAGPQMRMICITGCPVGVIETRCSGRKVYRCGVVPSRQTER